MMVKLQNTIKLLLQAACVLFLYNCGATAFLESSLRSCGTSLHSKQLLRPSMHTRQQRRKTVTNNASLKNHKLLLHAALDATESFNDNVTGAKAASSLFVDKAELVLSDFHVITRVDAVDKIKHIELYLRRRKGGIFSMLMTGVWWAFFIQFLPIFLRPKPCAKTGVRTYTSSSIMMDNLVKRCFGEDALKKKMEKIKTKDIDEDNDKKSETTSKNLKDQSSSKAAVESLNPSSAGSANIKWASKANIENKALATIGLFVYMWIAPALRKKLIGNILLEEGKSLCRGLGADHMILVHDDNGSGKLITYYTDRGFQPIFDVIDKGMIGQL